MSIYPGYSWSITQHIGPATDKATMTAILKAAYNHANDKNPGDRITEELVAQNLLTENIREDAGRAQTWRDYQQVLSELGLIVSTRFTDNIVVTPIGLMLLDGLIGYSELLTTQSLRYQYPNGHKQDISSGLKDSLTAASLSIPQTRTELDSNFGIQIKPAVLLLRILTELNSEEDAPRGITVNECVKFILPTKSNSDWRHALKTFLAGDPHSRTVDVRTKRHIQEWFRLLNETDLFVTKGGKLFLRQTSSADIAKLKTFCDVLEDTASFWSPVAESKGEMAISWFNHFGNPPIEQQWVNAGKAQTEDYIQENYSEGINPIEIVSAEDIENRTWSSDITLRDFVPNTDEQVNAEQQVSLNIENALAGLAKRKEQTRLHEYIISKLAERLTELGYSLSDDPLSVDLLATKSGEDEVIFEVKTVTIRSIPHRLRLGVGQLLEYRFRRSEEKGNRPVSILVISSSVTLPEWMIRFFESELHVGLMGFNSQGFRAYTSGTIENYLSAGGSGE